MVWKDLMKSIESLPADTYSDFPLFPSIRHQVFHGAGVHRFRFPQFSKKCFFGEVDCSHLFAVSLITIH